MPDEHYVFLGEDSMSVIKLSVAAMLVGTAFAPAQAGHFLFEYNFDPQQSQAGSPMTASLYLTTSDMLNALGGYDILAATGTIDGDAVLGLTPNPNQPNSYTSGAFTYDNVLFTSGYAFDGPGLLVHTATLQVNFLGDPGGYYAISADGSTRVNSHGQTVFVTRVSVGAGSLTAVPEPASWVMTILGFGLIGAAMRQRSTVRFA
jgi:hypothetical protein